MAVGQKSEIIKHGVDVYDSIQCMVKWKLSDGTEFSQTLLTSWLILKAAQLCQTKN